MPAQDTDLPPGAARLPLELCELVIDHVSGYYDLNDSLLTLRACTLTCRAWEPRARRNLWRFGAVVRSAAHLDALLRRLDAAPGARELRLLDVRAGGAGAGSWVSALPLRLGGRLAHLRRLRLAAPPPVLHAGALLALGGCFRALTGLMLARCAFARFAHFARLVLACRGLVRLYVSDVRWPAQGTRDVACAGMRRMRALRLEVLNLGLNEPGVVADVVEWVLCTASRGTLHTVSLDFPPVEEKGLVAAAVQRLLAACGPRLVNLRARFDNVKVERECGELLRTYTIHISRPCSEMCPVEKLDLGSCPNLRQIATRAYPYDTPFMQESLARLLGTLPHESNQLEEVLLWAHGSSHFAGFAWTDVDQLLSQPRRFPRFKKFSVTVETEAVVQLLPRLASQGKVVDDETDSDHGCVRLTHMRSVH